MNQYDISDYTLEELREAFTNINDVKYPKRAVKLYLRIKELEARKRKAEKKKEKTPSKLTIKGFLKICLYFILAISAQSYRVRNGLENQQEELESKVRRIKAQIKNQSNIKIEN